MPISKKTQEQIDTLFAEGQRVEKFKTTEGLGLKSGRRSIILVNAAGAKTPAGTYYEQKSGTDLPEGGFLQQAARRDGNVETIQLRDGRRGITRRWEAGGEYKFTQLGKKYYATLRRNYVADVPIIIKGKRKNNTTYTIKSHMKREKLNLRPVEVPLNLTHDQRMALVKRMILKELKDRAGNDDSQDLVLYEVSDEQWTLDPEGSWRIHEETVGVDPETGAGEAHVVLDRRVRAPEPLISNNLLFPHAICEEAYEAAQDNLCAPRQMAALLKQDVGEICYKLTQISRELYKTEVWEENGATPRMIMEFCKKESYGCVVVWNEEVIETLTGHPILAFTVHEDHVFFYRDSAVRRALAKRRGLTTRLQRAVARQMQTPPASEWKPWAQDIAPEHFWVHDDDISAVRRWFLEQRRSPKVIMKDETRVRTLIYNLRKREGFGTCYVHSLPEKSGEMQKWIDRLQIDLQYHGEGLPALSLKVLQTLVKRGRERTWLTGEEKAQILEEHDFCCAVCASKGQLEFDHIARLSESYDEQKFQPRCVECHREKTAQEARMYDGDQLASHFELEVWKQYVESPRPPPLIARLRDCKGSAAGLEIADVVRCRRSALLYNVHPLPVFCPLDDAKVRTECTLGDLNLVAMPLPRNKAFANFLGYAGPGWQHRVQTEWLLHTSVIAWEHITHTLTATAHLPAGLLAEPLEIMERAWEGSELAKLSINSLIGLWAIDDATTLKVRTSTREDDKPKHGCLTSLVHYEGGLVYDFITRTKLVTNASCRPLHDLCMCTEAVRVGQMLLAIKMAGAIPYELKTDSVLFKAKKRSPVELDKLTFRDLGTLYTKSFPLARPILQLGVAISENKPFRQARARDSDLLRTRGCEESLTPQRSSETPTTSPKPRPWQECTPEEGERRVLDKESLFVQGIAGTGKTTYCQGIVERLQAAGERVDIISKTHVASRRAGGCTADHWVRRHVINGSPKCTVLWIDEISQIDVGLLLQICKLTFCQNIRFILSGDFNQFSPIGNNFRGTPVEEVALQNSNLLHTLAGGNRVTLVECRRSDKELFDFYASLVEGGVRNITPLHSVLAEARATFNYPGFCRNNLVISHRKRIQLNRQINEQHAPPCAVRIVIGGRVLRGNSAQTMLIWPGIELLGAVPTERKGIRNGCLYTVAEIGEETVSLQELPGVTLTFEQVKLWLRLSYAQTYASVQGSEFTAQLRLHDTTHHFFTLRHLFVGLSRARAAQDVSVVD